MTRRISPFTDFGFKYLFGQEDNKDLLIDFLNTLLANEPGFEKITDVTYCDKEHPRGPESERGIIYDIKCTTSSGKFFIVEMQNAYQEYFINRSIYYASRSIVEQGQPGGAWNYRYEPVYVVAFLNFTMDALGSNIRTDCALCDLDTHKPISDKMRFVYIQMPLFRKKEEECDSVFDYWMYNIKNMENMNSIAFTQQHRIFKRLESVTNYYNLNEQQRRAYDEDLKIYRDLQNCMDFREAKGRAEGEAFGKANTIRQLLDSGMSVETVANALHMTVKAIKDLVADKS